MKSPRQRARRNAALHRSNPPVPETPAYDPVDFDASMDILRVGQFLVLFNGVLRRNPTPIPKWVLDDPEALAYVVAEHKNTLAALMESECIKTTGLPPERVRAALGVLLVVKEPQ